VPQPEGELPQLRERAAFIVQAPGLAAAPARGETVGDCRGDWVAARIGAACTRAACARGPTTLDALTALIGWPVAEAICATGGPNARPRGDACAAASGDARATMAPVCAVAITWTEMGWVKCCSCTATQAGEWTPKTKPRGPIGAQAQNPNPTRQLTQAGAQ
jgi:hypothetical protein